MYFDTKLIWNSGLLRSDRRQKRHFLSRACSGATGARG